MATTHDSPPRDQQRPAGSAPRRLGLGSAALIGLVAVGLTFGIAELLAALGMWTNLAGNAASPITSLGTTFIKLTPEWLKHFAITTFGTNDKLALKVGMAVTVIIASLVLGVIGRRSPRIGTGLALVLIIVTAVAILTGGGGSLVDVVPLLIGAVFGLWFLVTALRVGLGLPARGPVPSNAVASESIAPKAPKAADTSATAVPTALDTAVTDETAAATRPQGKVRLTGEQHPMAVATAQRKGYDRRAFFRIAGLGAVVAVAAGAISRWIPSYADVEASRNAVTLPNATDVQAPEAAAKTFNSLQGITTYVTPNSEFYRIDTAFTFPGTTTANWSLKIHGAVDNPIEITYADLIKRTMIERTITLTCVSNEVGGTLAGNAVWQGVRISDLIKEAKPRAGADCVLSTSAQDGFNVTTPIEALTDDRDAILAVKMNGEPLPIEHGFPVRMVVPGLYGYVSAVKWVVDMEVTNFDQVTSYWTDRGWSPKGPIKTASRIDVPTSFAQLPSGRNAVGGVAWAQHRGIKSVQVQVDDGEWSDVTISAPVSKDTWVQWKYEWDAKPGQHTLRVRAVDGDNQLQTGTRQQTIPDGATGWHSRVVTVS